MVSAFLAILYRITLKPIFFTFDPELVHNSITFLGKVLGQSETGRNIVKNLFYFKDKGLNQSVSGISFENPIGKVILSILLSKLKLQSEYISAE